MDTDTAADWSSGGTHTTRADGGTPGCWDVLADRSRNRADAAAFPAWQGDGRRGGLADPHRGAYDAEDEEQLLIWIGGIVRAR